MTKLSIIIVTYNNAKIVRACLDAIPQKIAGLNINLFVVDNNSSDNTWKVLKKYQRENFFISQSKKNFGFAKSVNRGIKFCQKQFEADFFFLLNPDAILKKNCLQNLIKATQENKAIGLFSPLIFEADHKKLWFAGAKINWWKFKTEHFEQCSSKKTSDYLSGCALLIDKRVIKKIGFFDERFFLYYEDVDFSLRVKQVGFKLNIIENAVCYHQESQSSIDDFKTEQSVKSGLLFFYQYYSFFALPYFWSVFYLRLFYHQYFSQKKAVIKGMQGFLEVRKRD